MVDDATRTGWERTRVYLAAGLVLALVGSAADAPDAVARGVLTAICLCCVALCFALGTALAVRWRWTDEPEWAWLATAAVAGGFAIVTIAIPAFPLPVRTTRAQANLIDVLLVAALVVLLWYAAARRQFPSQLAPVSLGLLIGVSGLLAGTLLGVVVAGPGRNAVVAGVSDVVRVAFGATCLWLLRHHLHRLSVHDRRWVTAGGVLAFVGGVVGTSAIPVPIPGVSEDVFRTETLALAGTGFTLVAAMLLSGRAVPAIAGAPVMEPVAAEVPGSALGRDDQLHEVRASLAGLSSALHLLTDDVELSGVGRAHLSGMLGSEVDRLQRLLGSPGSEVPRPGTLDDVLVSVVGARRVVGQHVRLGEVCCAGCTDLRCAACTLPSADIVIEILNILLVNAATHAPGAAVAVSATAQAGTVQLRVTDDGPGVPDQLRARIFERGARRPDSPGRGIGLELARRLARSQGGELWLGDAAVGAAFVLALPSAAREECA